MPSNTINLALKLREELKSAEDYPTVGCLIILDAQKK